MTIRVHIYSTIFYCCCRSNCSNSSAERNKNAADSRYPVISCLTAAISPVLNLWFNSGFCFILKSAGPVKRLIEFKKID